MYYQRNPEERYQIYRESKAGISVSDLAKSLGRHSSTIYQEFSRNRGGCGYRPKQAHESAEERKSARRVFPYSGVGSCSCRGLFKEGVEPGADIKSFKTGRD